MVVGAQPQSQSQSQPQQVSQKPPQPEPSPEDEALKRNTDCVYFLASPVSCKKGSECEYRHSEQVLYNPRDCWFWLNGNCLNLKCSFRHPPLEGLLASPAASSAGPSLPIPHTAPSSVPASNATFNSSKQAVPCIFFQRGFCSKADKCPFSHGPNSVTASKILQAPAVTHGTEPSGLKKVFGGLQKCNQEVKVPQVSASKNVVVPPQSKPAPKAVTAPLRNGVSIERYVPPPGRNFNDETVRYEARSGFPAMNGNSTVQADRYLQAHVSENHGFQNGKDVDEHLRESSPGFDVLVDDELGDSDYYHGEEQFGRTIVHDGRNLNSMNEYDLDHPANFNPIADGDRERFDPRGYDPYNQMQGKSAWDPRRNSSERLVGGPPHSDRRGYRKSDSPEDIDGLDLRHRLSKHRRGDGLRSSISNDYDSHAEERRSRPRRDQQQLPSHEGSLSSRLCGRIKLPGGSPPITSSDMRLVREDRGRNRDMRLEREERGSNRGRSRDRSHDRNRDRLSPRGRDRPQSTSLQGRLRDRIQGRVQEDSRDNDGRTYKPPHMRREIPEERNSEISCPKRSSEPKTNNASMNNNQQSEGVLSFDGPMPLSEILKRKREAAASGSRKRSSVGKLGNSEKEGALSNAGTSGTGEVTTALNSQSHAAEEEIKSAAADTVGTENEKNDVASQEQQEIEDGVIYDETAEYQELEGEDQQEGEYAYEEGEDGEYAYEEGEEVEGEEEYQEEEDGGDFAKKIGVMFS